MSELTHQALVCMLAESNRSVPIDRTDPVIAALEKQLQAASLEAMAATEIATQKSIAVQAALTMVIPFAKENQDLDENDPLVVPLLNALKTSRIEFNEAAAVTVTKLQAALDIISRMESTARNSCIRFN